MTNSEREIYAAIKEFITRNGYSPTVREIGEIVGLKSSSSVHDYLLRIKEQGYITFEPYQPRTLRVLRHV